MLPCSSSILIKLEDGSTTGATPNHLRAQFTSEKVSRLRVKIEKVMKDLPEELRDLVMRHQDIRQRSKLLVGRRKPSPLRKVTAS